MPSLPRYAILENHSTFHVTWQCHNQDWLLKDAWAKSLYYRLLLKYKTRYKIKIYSYCFMDNHPHLSGSFESLQLFSDFFRVVNSCFSRSLNKQRGRKGQVVMDRFKSQRIQNDEHLLNVMTYIDLNPKRAGKVNHPHENEFSSYRYYAYGEEDPLITPAPSYLDLGISPQERQNVYRERIQEILKNDWKQKKPYSSIAFIGNPDWVIEKTKTLETIKKEQFIRYRERFRNKFG